MQTQLYTQNSSPSPKSYQDFQETGPRAYSRDFTGMLPLTLIDDKVQRSVEFLL